MLFKMETIVDKRYAVAVCDARNDAMKRAARNTIICGVD